MSESVIRQRRRDGPGVPAAWRRLPALGQDAILAATAWLIIVLLPALDRLTDAGPPNPVPWTAGDLGLHIAVVTCLCAPLLVRRRFPILSTVTIGAVMVLAGTLGVPTFRGGLPVLIGFVAATSASYYRGGWWRPALAALIVIFLWFGLVGRLTPAASDVFMVLASALLPVTLGWVLRMQRDRAREQAQLREATHRRIRAEDHTRIAREVHDSVGHHLSSIRLRAVGALADRSSAAAEPLQSIADTSAVALAEIRRLLELLRADEPAPPVPLAELRALAREAGDQLPAITVEVDSACPERIPHDAFRVVQESVTNVIRHSGASTARIVLARDGGTLVLTVDDDGPARPGTAITPGHGLPGMAQRVHRAGGAFVAGPRAPHGWSVRATFPLPTGATP
ncbi:sensor histidine kinase [Microlunatus speluncae]|uniref:sensor histidine kinase n=1 Tax=Microlunatus speluncae TaxID=2594267 RepID=UPI0012666601|nr:sensor histidine kinase [Microlunatus speluncae]